MTNNQADALKPCHELKTDPEVFDAMQRDEKNFEIRFNDRNYKVGDRLRLRRTQYSGVQMKQNPTRCPLLYTGEELLRSVAYILAGPAYGLESGWVIMAMKTTRAPEPEGERWPSYKALHGLVTELWKAAGKPDGLGREYWGREAAKLIFQPQTPRKFGGSENVAHVSELKAAPTAQPEAEPTGEAAEPWKHEHAKCVNCGQGAGAHRGCSPHYCPANPAKVNGEYRYLSTVFAVQPKPESEVKSCAVHSGVKAAVASNAVAPSSNPTGQAAETAAKQHCIDCSTYGPLNCPEHGVEAVMSRQPTAGSGEGVTPGELLEWALAHAMACVYQHSGPASVMGEAPEPVAIVRHFLKAATSAAEQALREAQRELRIEHDACNAAGAWVGELKAKLAAAEQREQSALTNGCLQVLAREKAERRAQAAEKSMREGPDYGYHYIVVVLDERLEAVKAERDAARSEVDRIIEITKSNGIPTENAVEAVSNLSNSYSADVGADQITIERLTRELAEANTDAAYASEAIETIKGCFPEDHPCRHPETGVSVIGGVSDALRELAEAREALRAALIPLAVLKMGQQTKPYAEHTATLTAEIAWAHDAVYATLLKAQEGKA